MAGDEGVSVKIDKTLKEIFSPEFLNRIDEIIEFKELTKEELLKIEDLMLADVKAGVKALGGEFVIADEAKEMIIDSSYSPRYGARPIRREIQRVIEDPLSEIILASDSIEGTVIEAVVENGKIVVKER